MVTVRFTRNFRKKFKKIRDATTQEKILKQLTKFRNNPSIGKPMRYARKGSREVYIAPYRLVYQYVEKKALINVINIYHKDEQ